MHIGLICNELPPGPHGGVGSFTADLADGLAAAGHEVTVFIVEMGDKRHWTRGEEQAGPANPRIVPVHLTSPGWMRWRPGALWMRRKLLLILKAAHARTPFDLIECMDNCGLLPFGGIRGIPTLVRLHGASYFFDLKLGSTTTDPFTHRLEMLTLKRASHLIAVSDYIGVEEPALAGLKRVADRTIYNAVDTQMFSPVPEDQVERGLIVFANSIHPRKGVSELCRAMNVVGIEYPAARLVIIGKEMTVGASGRRLSEELAEELDPRVKDRVIFTGRLKYRSEVLSWLQRAHVCCYPSMLEGFGIAPVEAMALGKPTIFSRTGPGPEVIEDGVSGLLCDPASPADIARKIGMVLGDDALARSMGAAARKRVEERFERKGWIARNIAFYEETLAGAGGGRF